jgi:putative ABC transport system permease protein
MVNVDLGDLSYTTFRNDAVNVAGVRGISATSALPGVEFPTKTWISRETVTDSVSVSTYSVDTQFLENFDVDLVAGRNFSPEFATDSTQAVMINETAAARLGYEVPNEAIGKFLSLRKSRSTFQIIGVVKDFQFDFLWEPISPLVLRYHPSEFRTASIRLEAGNHKNTLANLEMVWEDHEAIAPFNYRYYHRQIENVYNDFKELVGIVAFLSVLAILITSFGLLAMAHYNTQSRIKEIGVRKVLGARVQSLVWMLSRDFLKMIGLALVIGVPIAVYLNSLWLQVFSTKAHFGIGIILAALLITTSLSLISVCTETYRAAIKNPVHTLSSE